MNESEEFKFAQIALSELLKTPQYHERLTEMSDAVNEYFNFIDRNGIKDIDECEIAALSPAGLIVPVFVILRKTRLGDLEGFKWNGLTGS
jgi:hypothetical protein